LKGDGKTSECPWGCRGKIAKNPPQEKCPECGRPVKPVYRRNGRKIVRRYEIR